MELLKQPLEHPLSMEEQVVILYAATSHLLEDIPKEKLKTFPGRSLRIYENSYRRWAMHSARRRHSAGISSARLRRRWASTRQKFLKAQGNALEAATADANWISSKAVMEDAGLRDPEPDPRYSGYAQDHERDVPDIFDEIKKPEKNWQRRSRISMHCKCHPAYPEASAEHGKSLFLKKEGHQSEGLVISGDRGLAGAYNHNIMKMADTF